jgi:hypothetical protein
MRELVEKKTGVSFRYINLRTFVLLPIFVFAMKIEYSYLMLLVSFCIIFHNVYLFRLKRAVNLVEIPPDIFLKPSKTSLKIWENFYICKGWLYEVLGVNLPGQKPIIQAYDKLGKNISPGLILGFATASVTGCGGFYYFSESFYTSRGKVSPLMMWQNKNSWGFTSDNLEILNIARSLSSRGCNMRDFCYPGTNVLDPSAIQRANDYISFNRDSGKIIGVEVPLPVGPHGQITDSSNLNIEKETSVLK